MRAAPQQAASDTDRHLFWGGQARNGLSIGISTAQQALTLDPTTSARGCRVRGARSADLLVALALELEVLDKLGVLALLVDQLGVLLLQHLLQRLRRVAGG